MNSYIKCRRGTGKQLFILYMYNSFATMNHNEKRVFAEKIEDDKKFKW